jgi:hypothetical protein
MKRALEDVALEEQATGEAFEEIEYVFYARLPEPVKVPTGWGFSEHQEQWEFKIPKTDQNGGQGGIRIRKTQLINIRGKVAPEYVITTKVRKPDGSNTEVAVPTTEDNFEQFRVLSDRGMVKNRYEYVIDDGAVPAGLGKGLKWEVDFFLKPDGTFFPWVKIDLEVRKRVSDLSDLPPFPFEAEEWILRQTGERDAEEEAKLRGLYDTMFLAKNRFARLAPEPGANAEDGSSGLPAPNANMSKAEQTALSMGARFVPMPEGLGFPNREEVLAMADPNAAATTPVELEGHFYQVPNPAEQGSVVASFGAQKVSASIFPQSATGGNIV